MARIFLSHSSANNAEAVAFRDWLIGEGWDDLFLDLDPERGIAAGERWERALSEAANRCEAVLFLVSRAWLDSRWCLRELNLAVKLNKRIFGVLIEDIPIADVPADLKATWQLVNLAAGTDHLMFRAVLPSGEEAHVTFSKSGLLKLKNGLSKAGLDARFFAWPPHDDPDRPPYRGLRPLEAEDAGIFFGREAPTIEVLDGLRGLSEAAPPRVFIILGASGAGKSSFLRAGLVPRLQRDDRHFLLLPIVRPQQAALTGETGLLRSLETAFKTAGLRRARAEVKAALEAGASAVGGLLDELAEKARPIALAGESKPSPPALVLPIDQAEELFLAEGAEEAQAFLGLVRDLASASASKLIVLPTIRSDAFEQLQTAPALEGVNTHMYSLPPLPKGAYQTVIEGPAARLRDTPRALKIEPSLTAALLADIETGGAKDALPLLCFTLERLYLEHGGDGDLKLAEYQKIGGIRGSIEAAVEHALKDADRDPGVPKDRAARLALLRRALIPWLAGIDPETGAPRRRVARLSEIPEEARPLVAHLIAARLLATDVTPETGERTIEPAHESVLRQWGLLQGWLEEDFAALSTLEGVKRASRDWAANGRDAAWLAHSAGRLEDAEALKEREDLARSLETTDRAYLDACRTAETARRDRELKEARKLAAAQKQAADRQRILTWGSAAAAVVFAVIASVAVLQFFEAGRARTQAERNLQIVTQTADELAGVLTTELATDFRTPTDELGRLIEFSDKSFSRLAESVEGAEVSVRYGQLLTAGAGAYLERGEVARADRLAERALDVLTRAKESNRFEGVLAKSLAAALVARAQVDVEMARFKEVYESAASVASLAPGNATVGRAWAKIMIEAALAEAGAAIGRYDWARADEAIERAVRAIGEKESRLPADIARTLRVKAQILRASLFGASGREPEAIPVLAEALTEVSDYLTEAPDDLRWRSLRAEINYRKGWWEQAVVDPDSASQSLAAASDELAELVSRDRHNRRWRQLATATDVSRASLLRSYQAWPHAHRLLEEARDQTRILTAAEPGWWRGAVLDGLAWFELSRLYLDKGEDAKAEAALGALGEAASRVAQRFPQSVDMQRWRAIYAYYLGTLAEQRKEFDAALKHFAICADAAQSILARTGGSPALLSDVAYCEAELGRFQEMQGAHEEALSAFRRSVAARAELVASQGRAIDADALAYSRIRLADFLRTLQKPGDARIQYETAATEVEEALKRHDSAGYLKNHLIFVDERLGRLSVDAGTFQAALEYYERGAERAMNRLAVAPSDETTLRYLDGLRHGLERLKKLKTPEADLSGAEAQAIAERATDMLERSDAALLLMPKEYTVEGQAMAPTERQGWVLGPFMPGIWYELVGADFLELSERMKAAALDRQTEFSAITRIRARKVDFYPDARLLEGEVVANGRRGIVAFVEHDDELYLLDGSSPQMHRLNESLLVRLDRVDRAAQYLRFFVGALQGPDGRFVIVDRIEDVHFARDVPVEKRESLARLIRPFVVRRGSGGAWEATGTMQYADTLSNILIRAERNGYADMPIGDHRLAEGLQIGRERFVNGIRVLEPYDTPSGRPGGEPEPSELETLLAQANDARAQGDHVAVIRHLGEVVRLAQSAYQAGEMSNEDLAGHHGNLAYNLLFVGDSKAAAEHSRTAMKLSPLLWLETNLAHALMFQGRIEEAEAIYLKNGGLEVPGKLWEQAVIDDFAELRKAGRQHPYMAVIEGKLRKRR